MTQLAQEKTDASRPMSQGSGHRSEVENRKTLVSDRSSVIGPPTLSVALLTGGGDKPYAVGMAAALTSEGISVDFIGSDDLDVPEVVTNPRVNFLTVRCDQLSAASRMAKVRRVSKYYLRLISYAATAKPKLFHILWNNKFRLFDRTLLMLYYRLLGKKVVFTAHNVNAGKRDSNDSWMNRLSLKVQYSVSDHILVHSERMKTELIYEVDMAADKVSAIPFVINNTVPNTALSTVAAKHQLGINRSDKTVLFFSHIAPYKGREYLISASVELLKQDGDYRLITVGKPNRCEDYWNQIQLMI